MASTDLKEFCIDKIHEQGYAPIEIPLTGADINPVFSTFRHVISDVFESPSKYSQDIFDAFHVVHSQRPYDSAGFIQQRRVGQANPFERGRQPGTDNKDVLHFTPLTADNVYQRLASRGGVPYSVKSLIEQCTDIHYAVMSSVRPAFQALGIETDLFAPEGHEADNIHLLRIIRYVGSNCVARTRPYIAHDELAELHFDRAKFTTALWESKSGLVGAPGNNGYGDKNLTVEELDLTAALALSQPIVHHSGEVKLFAGAGYNHLSEAARVASGRLPLLLHGVVQDHPGEERDAIVLFMNEHAGVKPSVADYSETGFSNVRQAVLDRQLRHGGMVA